MINASNGNCLASMGHPLELRWSRQGQPLPMRAIHAGTDRPVLPTCRPSPTPRSHAEPFDYSAHMRKLCEDIAQRSPELRHLDVSRILIAVTQARSDRRYGLQARVTPLRFRHGVLIRQRGGFDYQVQRYIVDGRDMLYLITFCLPRFCDQDFEDKLVTVFHELYHINPEFDGDLRHLPGRYRLHSHSQRGYDAHMLELARAYLQSSPADVHDFLRFNFAQLQRRYGSVVGVVVPRPKVVPVMLQSRTAARKSPP